jgi:hypothetical protein
VLISVRLSALCVLAAVLGRDSLRRFSIGPRRLCSNFTSFRQIRNVEP